MHILYDHQIFTWQKYGGISRYFYELMTHLAHESKVDVSLFLGLHVNAFDFHDHRKSFKHYFGVKLPGYTRCSKFINNALFCSMVAPVLHPDIYHQTYYGNVAPHCSGRRIVTVHDMIHERFPQYFSPTDSAIRNKKESVNTSDGIICVSQSTKNDLMQYYHVPEQKVRVIYHGNSLHTAVTSNRIHNRPYVLYVGLRNLYKGFDQLVSAYAQSPKVHDNYYLVCFGGGKFTKQEHQNFVALGIDDKIMAYSGTDELLANLYHYASVFVYPSQYEGFGMPLIEAMYHGCPVVASHASSLPEVGGNAALYFNPDEQDDLPIKLEMILSDTQLQAQLRQSGYEQEKKFGWDRCARETLHFYKEINGT